MERRHFRKYWGRAGIFAALLGLVAVGCDDTTGPDPAPSPGMSECGAANFFRPREFSNSCTIDNRWFPLVPGLQFILDGTANRGGVQVQHRVVFTVTDLVKNVDGVCSVVMWDRDYYSGVLEEAELAFFAQDNSGNIWTMGEYPEEYERGEFLGAPSTWIGGVAGADPGILVPGDSRLGFTFLQGWAPEVNFLDCGTTYAVGQSACVAFNCYENVLVVDEWSPLDVGSGHQRKYYAPGVGVVLVGAVDDPENETLGLANEIYLTPAQLEAANEEALELEARAYQINEAYQHTSPAVRRSSKAAAR